MQLLSNIEWPLEVKEDGFRFHSGKIDTYLRIWDLAHEGLRAEKTRREELLSIEAAWSAATKSRVAQERREKRKPHK